MPTLLYREALNQALAEEMERDGRVFIMGEDVGKYDGAYKVTRGLLKRFGETRVVDCPISENGFVGVGVGAANAGLRPVIELMSMNFAWLALDQIMNHAAKLRYLSGGQVATPLVIRGPNGPAEGLGAQHAQSMESVFAHVPGLKVVAPATPADAKGLLKAAIRDENPVIFLENESLYSLKGETPEGEWLCPIGQSQLVRSGSDVTIVSYGRMVHACLAAVRQLEDQYSRSAEVIDLRSLRPLDLAPVLESVAKTGRAMVVSEAWPVCSLGTEIAHQITLRCFDSLKAAPVHLAAEDVPMPYAEPLARAVLPSAETIVERAQQLVTQSKTI